MQWWERPYMETKRPCIRVRACGHVSAPDYPAAGYRLLPLARGPVTKQVVRDPVTGPGPLLREQDSGPQGSGCLDVVKDNYMALALTQQEGVPQCWGTDTPDGY